MTFLHIYLVLKPNKYYKGLERTKKYTLKDLGLFKTNYKITLSEFWNSKDKLAIHCNTREKADKFLKESNKTGKWGDFGSCYGVYREKKLVIAMNLTMMN